MAESATPDSVNKDQTNVDYSRALEIIQTRVHALESDQRSLSKDAQEAWGDIEQLGVNKEGAKGFSKILKKPVDKRRDEFRTFVNLAKAAGWFEWLDDLVDRAQSGPVTKPAPAAPQAPAPAKAKAETPPPPPPPEDQRDLSNAAHPERVNLKKGWIQRLKLDAPEACDLSNDDFWDDVRQATPAELAAERERIADFPADGGPTPDIEEAKDAAAEKVTSRRKLHVVGGGKGK